MKSFKDTIPWDIIDAPIPDNFFGDDAVRVNLIRHGIKNGIITQSRVLADLKTRDRKENLTPTKKYKGNVGDKIDWIEQYYFPRCMEEIHWFEAQWGGNVRQILSVARQAIDNDQMGNYPSNVSEI